MESTLLKWLSSSGWHREQLFSSRGNDTCYSVIARRGADNLHPIWAQARENGFQWKQKITETSVLSKVLMFSN